MAARCDTLHAVSSCTASQLLASYPLAKDRISIAPYIMTSPVSDGSCDTMLHSDEMTAAWPRLLCLGRLVPHKCVDDAIKAVAYLRAIWPHIMLLIVGTGPQYRKLNDLINDLGVGNSVRLIGESRNPGQFFDWADLLVHPSLYEGYPRVFAEAFFKGVPVVSVDAPYAHDYMRVGGCIFLARPADSSSLATTIATALGSYRSNVPGSTVDGSDLQTLKFMYERVLADTSR